MEPSLLDQITSAMETLLPIRMLPGYWIAAAGVLFVIVTLVRHQDAEAIWQRRLISGLIRSLAFIGLVILSAVLLFQNHKSFSAVYGSFTTRGSLSDQAFEAWHAMYGEPLIQRELTVTHYVNKTTVETIEPVEPNQPVMYRDVTSEELLEQESITAFRGDVTLNLVNRLRQEDSFNAFAVTALYEYEISNPSDQTTRAEFHFPIESRLRVYRDVHVRINGEEFDEWQTGYSSMKWDYPMQPGQVDRIEIQYSTYGMNDYYYWVDAEREVRDFQLKLAFETDNH